MQAVKWRIAFFYFDMNIFQIRICLGGKLSIEAPSCPNDLTMDSPRIYSIAEPDISSMGLVRDSSGLFTMPADTM